MTNSLGFLPQTDLILMLDGGRVVEKGTYQELIKHEEGVFADFMRKYLSSQEHNLIENESGIHKNK